MLDHVVLSPRITQPGVFRVQWTPIEYACREANGSLKPVPPGATRERLYCGQCRVARCLFTNRPPILTSHVASAYSRCRGKIDVAAKRARGLNSAGRRLTPCCWNCTQLRVKLGGYVCRFEPETQAVAMGTMVHRRADGCQSFAMRLVMEIPPLNGNYRTKGETK